MLIQPCLKCVFLLFLDARIKVGLHYKLIFLPGFILFLAAVVSDNMSRLVVCGSMVPRLAHWSVLVPRG